MRAPTVLTILASLNDIFLLRPDMRLNNTGIIPLLPTKNLLPGHLRLLRIASWRLIKR